MAAILSERSHEHLVQLNISKCFDRTHDHKNVERIKIEYRETWCRPMNAILDFPQNTHFRQRKNKQTHVRWHFGQKWIMVFKFNASIIMENFIANEIFVMDIFLLRWFRTTNMTQIMSLRGFVSVCRGQSTIKNHLSRYRFH